MTHNRRSGVHVLALAAEAFGGRGGIARSTRDLMTALSGMPEVVYSTVDDRFTLGDRVAAMEKFGIPRDATVISTVSRLDPRERYKGHDLIVPLLKDLARDYPGLVYLVAGAGGDRARLERLARDADAADIARFLGFVADEDLPDLYRASDLYVMLSGGEGFGIAFVEAMACGTPSLGLALGGQVVRRRYSGAVSAGWQRTFGGRSKAPRD